MDDGPATVDAYIAGCASAAQGAMRRIREIVRTAAPHAREVISYRVPAFKGRGIILYYAAFKSHIAVYPPVRGDPDLDEALAPYRGPKGNLRLPLTKPIPFDLIERIARLRVKQDEAKGR